mgnify:CR=1 FL=1
MSLSLVILRQAQDDGCSYGVTCVLRWTQDDGCSCGEHVLRQAQDDSARRGLDHSLLHRSVYLTLGITGFDRVSAINLALTFCQTDQELGDAVLYINA